MHSAGWHYARYRNASNAGSGKLFEGPYWSRPIEGVDDAAFVTVYVDTNLRFAGVPPRYAGWTMLHHHAGEPTRSRVPGSLWSPSPWYLALGASVEARVSAYIEWLGDYQRRRDALLDAYEYGWLSPDVRACRVPRPGGGDAR
jgi:hypothetical protein